MIPLRTWLALLLLLSLPAQAAFYDPTPVWKAGVTDIAVDDGRMFASHDNGFVVAMDREGGLTWSNRVSLSQARGIALHEAQVYAVAASPPTLFALHAHDGKVAWQKALATGPYDVAADGTGVYVATDDRISRFTHAGASDWSITVDQPRSIDLEAGRVAFTGQTGAGWLTNAGIQATLPAGQDIAWHDGDLVLASEQQVRRFDDQGNEQANATFEFRPTTVAGGAHVVMGDAAGLVHLLGADLTASQPPIATYADSVQAIVVEDDVAITGFKSGWISDLALDTRPVALLLWPQEQRILPRTIQAEWAYSDPDGGPVDYVLQLRQAADPPAPWQDVVQGTLAAEPLTKLHTVPIDVSGFPDGARMDIRLVLTDADGNQGTETLSQPFVLDLTAPVARAGTEPEEGGVVITARPTIRVGHFDAGSGIDLSRREAWIDDNPDIEITGNLLVTTLVPRYDLSEGPHEWVLRLQDEAGNWRYLNGTFIVDDTAPEITAFQADSPGSTSMAMSWQTSEPATCTLRGQETQGMEHAAVVTGLEPATDHRFQVTCEDRAGRSAQASGTFTTRARAPGAAQPILDVVWPAPDAGDWYTHIPSVTASTDIPATIWWSIDGAPFTTTMPSPAPGIQSWHAFALSDEGEASAAWRDDIQIDVTAPPAPELEWLDGLRTLLWEAPADPESGTPWFHVETRTSGPFSLAGSVAWPGHRFDSVPPDATAVRLVAENAAGLRWTSPAVEIMEATEQRFTTASVLTTEVGPDDRLRVRFHLEGVERFDTGLVRDENGVETRFTDQIRLEGRTHEASTPGSTLPPGSHQVFIRVMQGNIPRDVPAGTVLVHGASTEAPDEADGPDSTIVDREDTPMSLVLVVIALVWAARRR